MLITTESGDLAGANASGRTVSRVGFAPDPWGWTPWEYADGGLFAGRWDDPNGVWRSVYVGASPLVCFLEVLAPFRPDPWLEAQLGDIEQDPADAAEHPTAAAGVVPRDWCSPRRVGVAHLSGWFVAPAYAESLPTLRAQFLSLAFHHGLADVDAAAIRLAEPRAFTQAVAGWLYEQSGPDGEPVAGVTFESRHGDGLRLWAIFERAGHAGESPLLHDRSDRGVDPDDADLAEAMRIHRLQWA